MPPAPATPWPATLEGTPSVAVIEQAIRRGRLAHSLLLHGDDPATLAGVAAAIADRLLRGPAAAAAFGPEQHPDCFTLRPAGKSRQISADATRALITKLQVSPVLAPAKVAILHEVDRMNTAAANVFLKTLEEPPRDTTLLMLTTRPYALLPTIRSRVLIFRFPTVGSAVAADGWPAWLEDYQAWLGRLVEGVGGDRKAVADQVLGLYGLVARFSAVLENATAEAWKLEKAKLPAELDDDEQVAIETGLAVGLRTRLLVEIEHATRAFALPRLREGDEPTRRALVAAVGQLEQDTALLRLNLNEAAALEGFLLASLRAWSRR